MFAITRPEDSDAMHARLLAIEERVFQGLELPYRVVDIAAGDLGAPAYRKFDIEAWMPGRGEGGAYGEVSATSNCTDYQARRLADALPPQGREEERVRPHAERHRGLERARHPRRCSRITSRRTAASRSRARSGRYVGRDVIGPK